jgi:hypothetical protein
MAEESGTVKLKQSGGQEVKGKHKRRKCGDKGKQKASVCVLLLIRHGDYFTYTLTEKVKRLITPYRKTQANQTARTLVSTHTCDKPLVEEIITSTMVRARETANIIHDNVASIPLDL